MPRATDVTPKKWTDISILYDDGDYSAIWGVYDGGRKCLGVRYNGDFGKKSFPLSSTYPVWYVEPQWIQNVILTRLLEKLLSLPQTDEAQKYVSNLLIAIREAQKQTSSDL